MNNEEALESEREKLFEVFKAGWMAVAVAIEGERDDPARGWNADFEGLSAQSQSILTGIKEGLSAAVSVVREGRRPSWKPRPSDSVQEAFDAWLQEQVSEVDVLGFFTTALSETTDSSEILGPPDVKGMVERDKVLGLKCLDCGDYFSLEVAERHSEPGVCVEWTNHTMAFAQYRLERVPKKWLQVTP